MCCLKYENEAYEYLHKRSPRIDAIVSTPQGQGTVVGVNLLRESVRVRLDTEPGNELLEVKVDDLEIIKDGGKRHGGDRAAPRRESNQSRDAKPADDANGRRPQRGWRPEPARPGRSGRDGGRNRDRRRNGEQENGDAASTMSATSPAPATQTSALQHNCRAGATPRQPPRQPLQQPLRQPAPAPAAAPATVLEAAPLIDWNDAVIEEPPETSAE